MTKKKQMTRVLANKKQSIVILLVICVLALGAWGGMLLTEKSDKQYFAQLPSEVKMAYMPELSLLDNPAPAGLWVTTCYQYVGYAEYSNPIECGVTAGELIGTSLTLDQAKVQFQKLRVLASSQSYTNIQLASNYSIEGAGSQTIPLHFSATGKDKTCSVVADYGDPSVLRTLSFYSGMYQNVPNGASSALFYNYQCSKRVTDIPSGYYNTQDHYGSQNPFIN